MAELKQSYRFQSKKEEEQTEDGAGEAGAENQSVSVKRNAELYMNNIVKYLIVPEGVEIPVGWIRKQL